MKSKINFIRQKSKRRAALLGTHRPKHRLLSARKTIVIVLLLLLAGIVSSVIAARLMGGGLSIAKLVLCNGSSSCSLSAPTDALRAKRDSIGRVLKGETNDKLSIPSPD